MEITGEELPFVKVIKLYRPRETTDARYRLSESRKMCPRVSTL